jgi:glycosyltransferase involved in cell wall biosynthesis
LSKIDSINYNPPITVLIPIFNEDRSVLERIVNEILDRKWNVILVDDGSSPAVMVQNPAVIILRHNINLGQGASLETGMEYARITGVKILVHMDGDGQHSVTEIDRLVKPVIDQSVDIVFGSRFLLSSSVHMIPFKRRIVLKISKWVNVIFTGLLMSDAHNGFRVLNLKAIQGLKLRTPGREHASEIIWRTRRARLKYVELPVHIHYNTTGKDSRIRFGEIVKLGWSLMKCRMIGYHMKDGNVQSVRSVALQEIIPNNF